MDFNQTPVGRAVKVGKKKGLLAGLTQILNDLQITDLGLGIEPMIVLSPKNVNIIKTALSKLINPTNLEIATEYMATKYPKLSSLASKVVRHPNISTTKWGSWDELTKSINIYNEAEQDLPNTVNTLGHELTHAMQSKKTPQIFEKYIPADVNFEKYLDQPAEQLARKGGTTATKSFNQFIEKLYPKYDVNKHITLDKDFLKEVVVPAWNEKYQNILNLEYNATLQQDLKGLQEVKRMKEAIRYDWDMLSKHLDPLFDPIASNRNPLTTGMLLGNLEVPTQGYQSFSKKPPINKYLKDFLLNRNYSGTTDVLIPNLNGIYKSPGVNLEINDLINKLLKK